MRPVFSRLRSADLLLILSIFALVCFGLAAIYSVELSQTDGEFLNVKKQAIAAAIGLAGFFFAALSNNRLLRNYAFVLYLSGVVLMLAVLVFGKEIRGTTGWFAFGPVSFQPVEWMKVVLAVALAAYMSNRARPDVGRRELLETGVIVGIPVGLTMLQPDLGSSLLLLGMWGVVLLVAGLKRRYIAVIIASGIALSLLAWQFFFKDYQRERIMTFINPSLDPGGEGYQVAQAIIAVGAGGWLGRGLGFGSQSQLKFLPESQTDFIFAVIAEELGFFGVSLVLGAFALLFARLLIHASRTRDPFARVLFVAIFGVLFVQFVINTGMNLGLLPVTGVTLPLVSYGGSSLIFTLFLLGIAVGMSASAARGSHPTGAVVE